LGHLRECGLEAETFHRGAEGGAVAGHDDVERALLVRRRFERGILEAPAGAPSDRLARVDEFNAGELGADVGGKEVVVSTTEDDGVCAGGDFASEGFTDGCPGGRRAGFAAFDELGEAVAGNLMDNGLAAELLDDPGIEVAAERAGRRKWRRASNRTRQA
jgi:hypothetical protein